MSLHAYALTTVESVKRLMRKQDEDILAPVLILYNSSGDATAAIYQITGTGLKLKVTGGTNAHDTTLTFADADKDTLTELVVAINALAKGWVVKLLVNGAQASADLSWELTAEVACLLYANRKTIMAPDNPSIEDLINAATDFMENFCKRRFKKSTYTAELYDGNGTTMLFLKEFPIISVTTIHWTYPAVADDLVDSTYYKIYHAGGYIQRTAGWIKGYQNIKVTYEAGYDFTVAIPSELQSICNALVNLRYNQPDRPGIKAEKMGGYSVSYSEDELPLDIKMRLKLWRKIDVF